MVKPWGRYLELAVRLRMAPDSVWKNEFARISHMTDGLETEPWWANVPDFDELTVGGIEVGTEAAVRKRLDGMIRQTNTAAGHLLRRLLLRLHGLPCGRTRSRPVPSGPSPRRPGRCVR